MTATARKATAKRLRDFAELTQREYDRQTYEMLMEIVRDIETVERETIERCAKVAELSGGWTEANALIARRIRALRPTTEAADVVEGKR